MTNTHLQDFVSKPLFKPSVILSHDSLYPKISVITPSYNQEAFIERTILSVLNQNYPNVEYIIVDDRTPDNSNEIIRKYGEFVKLAGDGTNRGQTAAINFGLRQTTGEIVTFQNADDLYAPNAFYELAKSYAQNPTASVFFGNLYIIDENDLIQNEMRMTPFSLEEHLVLGMQAHNQALFFKRELLNRVGYLDEKYNYSFDYELIMRFGTAPGVLLKYVENLWGAFRIHSQSKTTNITSSYKNERTEISQQYQKQLGTKPNYTWVRAKSYLRKLIYWFGQGQWNYLIRKLTSN
jgi:glycosyltransferase involved in cell wall biosynthesis